MELAGAFAAEPRVDCVCLVGVDSDFRPLIERVLDARRPAGLRVAVVAAAATLRHEYRDWLAGERAGVELVELTDVLQRVAPHVVNLRDRPPPSSSQCGGSPCGSARRVAVRGP
eukprot:gene12920-18477_t